MGTAHQRIFLSFLSASLEYSQFMNRNEEEKKIYILYIMCMTVDPNGIMRM